MCQAIIEFLTAFFSKETGSLAGLINLVGGLAGSAFLILGFGKSDSTLGQVILKLNPSTAIGIALFLLFIFLAIIIFYFYFCYKALVSGEKVQQKINS